MEFSFGGEAFVIDFSRRYRDGFKTRYPYTTATISKVVSPQVHEPVRTFTVGCYHRDNFTYEEGRKVALRGALYDDPRAGKNHPMSLSKAFKSAAWDAYFRRWKDGKRRVWAGEVGV